MPKFPEVRSDIEEFGSTNIIDFDSKRKKFIWYEILSSYMYFDDIYLLQPSINDTIYFISLYSVIVWTLRSFKDIWNNATF